MRTVVLDSAAGPAWALAETVTAPARNFGVTADGRDGRDGYDGRNGHEGRYGRDEYPDAPERTERTGRGVGRRVLFAAAGLSLVGAAGYTATRSLRARSAGFGAGPSGAVPIPSQSRSSAAPSSPSAAPSSASAGTSSSAAAPPPASASSSPSDVSSSSASAPDSSPPATNGPGNGSGYGSGNGSSASQVHTQPQYYIAAGPKMIALTLDDGPSNIYTPQILELLDQYQIKATFCMIGSQVAANSSLVREVAGAGHMIVNHTWNHADQSKLSLAGVRNQIARANDALAAVGIHPTVFRAPYGAWSRNVFQACADANLRPLDWSVDPRDWSLPGTNAIVANIMKNTRTGSIILEHDGGGDRSQTVAALKLVLPQLLNAGYRFTSV